MKIMSRDFTTREKIMLLVLTLILLAAGYYAVIDQPIRTAINEAKSQQDELNTELMLLQTKADLCPACRASWIPSNRAEVWEKWEATIIPRQNWMS